jgi:beta-xylosidase
MARADNPFVQTIYTADPAPMVYNGRVYVFTTHDEDGATWFDMHDWHVFSTNDMANWQDHGVVLSLDDFSWADLNAWAGQAVERNGKFYFYVPMRLNGAQMGIGVGVSDSITGPYTDARGSPLVADGEIDPTVFIDDDDQAYLFWGNPNLWYAKLNDDMISFAEDPQQIELTVQGFGPPEREDSDRPTAYEEGPWLYKRDGTYYMVYAANCCSEDIRYATAPSVTGPWTYGGIVMETEGGSFTNHPGVVDYEGNSYFFYHNGALPGGGGFTRSVAVEDFTYGSDGSIPQIRMTDAGPAQIRSLDPYVRQEAETAAWSEGVETEPSSDGGICVGSITPGDYIKVNGVDFGDGASSFTAGVATGGPGGTIEIRLGGASGTQVGACEVSSTGDYQTWATVQCDVSGAEGTHDLYFVFQGSGDGLFNFDWWQFE